MNTLNFTEHEIKDLIGVYSTKLAEAEASVSRFKGILDKLKRDLNKKSKAYGEDFQKQNELDFGDYSSENNSSSSGFDPNWDWGKKIDFVIRENGNKPLETSKIVNRLFVLEPSLGEDFEQRKATGRSVRATLSRKAKDGHYVKITDNDKYYTWALN